MNMYYLELTQESYNLIIGEHNICLMVKVNDFHGIMQTPSVMHDVFTKVNLNG